MTMPVRRIFLATALALGTLTPWMDDTRADSFGLANLASAAFSPDCLDWKIEGACLWIQCDLFGCRIVPSPKISHRLPDLVVQSYPDTGEPPWNEWRPIAQAAASEASSSVQAFTGLQLGGGTRSGVGTRKHIDALQFFETDVAGNPAIKLADHFDGKLLCKSAAKPMEPYFLSVTDAAAWRTGEAERTRIESITPGMREVGFGAQYTWGPVFPRTGFVMQPDPTRAAAVMAVRAVDIVVNDASGHIGKSFKSGKAGYLKRGDAKANTRNKCEDTGGAWRTTRETNYCQPMVWRQVRGAARDTGDHWQMITPQRSSRCESFGGEKSPSDVSRDGCYAWQWWQRYTCCMKLGGFAGLGN